jgi:hypothetical protein
MKSLGSGRQIVVAVVDEACSQVLKLLWGSYRFEAAPPGVGGPRRLAFDASVDVTPVFSLRENAIVKEPGAS